MNPEINALLVKAKRSQKAAANLLDDGDIDFSASRSYYSLFYTAEALLLFRGLSFSSHSAVLANFGKEFAKTKDMDVKFHLYLIDAQDKRNIGDYSIARSVSEEEAREMLDWAKEFIEAAENYLSTMS